MSNWVERCRKFRKQDRDAVLNTIFDKILGHQRTVRSCSPGQDQADAYWRGGRDALINLYVTISPEPLHEATVMEMVIERMVVDHEGAIAEQG